MKKRITMLFLAAVLALSLAVPVFAFGDTAYEVAKIATLEDGEGSQGAAVYENWLFTATNRGQLRVYDLSADEPGALVAAFDLGSATETNKGADANHANQMMFGPEKWDESDPFPLLYVTTGNSGAYDENGCYYSKCAIERISYDPDTNKWSAVTVQTIAYNDQANVKISGQSEWGDDVFSDMLTDGKFIYTPGGDFPNEAGYEKIGWGWPAYFVDAAPTGVTAGKLYLYSARFRTTAAYEERNTAIYGGADCYGGKFNYYDHNAYIITEFDLPALPESEAEFGQVVVLQPKDITDQFTTDYDIYFTQGGTLRQGKIYYPYGNESKDEFTRSALQIFDIGEKKIDAQLDLTTSVIKSLEPECCAFYNGQLILSVNQARVYTITYGSDPTTPTETPAEVPTEAPAEVPTEAPTNAAEPTPKGNTGIGQIAIWCAAGIAVAAALGFALGSRSKK